MAEETRNLRSTDTHINLGSGNSLFIMLILTLLWHVSCASKTTSETSVFPEINDWVNDYEDVLDQDQEATLNEFLEEYRETTTREIAILTVTDIDPYQDIQDYATDLGNHWGVGAAESNNGLIIVLSAQQRSVGIATGLGTEQVLSDTQCKETIDKIMIPYFKNGDYYLGLLGGIHDLMNKWDGSNGESRI